MENVKAASKWIAINWERILFAVFGAAFICVSFLLLFFGKVTETAVVFGLGFLCFIYANVARFKRFKGLGFEAELWEDKQKEAADLIERLRDVVSIYTREIVLGKVKSGRWVDKQDWSGRWKLYDDLVTQHSVLGQKIDFSELKKEMDDYFLFDMTMAELEKIREATARGTTLAMAKINKEFGNPIQNVDGYNKRIAQYHTIKFGFEDPFEIAMKEDLAGRVLSLWDHSKTALKEHFDVDAKIDAKVIERVEIISKFFQSRPVQVTDELIKWANREE